MKDGTWLNQLNELLGRFSSMGICPDIAAMTLCELWGVYCFLQRIEGG